jgi:hypothetical protein
MRHEDEALAHLMDDINNHGKDKRTGVGIPFLMFGAMLCLAVFILISASGCAMVSGGLRGLADDTDDLRDGAAEYFNEER